MSKKEVRLDKFSPRPYQLPIMDALVNKGYRRILCILPRRAGKDITAFNLMIREAVSKVAVYYYIFPTYAQAKKVLWDSITNAGERFLDYIPKELIQSKNNQEMKIYLINGSLIQLVGSDKIDSLVGTNPQGVIFSEYALQDPAAYQFLSPILLANKGWAIFISCVSPNTLVIGQKGLQRIKTVSSSREEYSDLNLPIYGLGGFHNAEQFYYGGKQKTLKITLNSGYELECTPVHPIWNGFEWVQSKDLTVGDRIPIQYGQDVWGDGLKLPIDLEDIDTASLDFFYLLGLIHADGVYDTKKICITNRKDSEIIAFLHKMGFTTKDDKIHHELHSPQLCRILEYIGCKHKSIDKVFPERLFNCTKEEMRAFLQGIFDGDGSSYSQPEKFGAIKYTTSCKQFAKDLQVVLLNFGIVSSLFDEKNVKSAYNVRASGHFAYVFYTEIGFRLPHKQKNFEHLPESTYNESGNVYPLDEKRIEDYFIPKCRVSNKSRMTRRMIATLNHEKYHPYFKEVLSEKLFYSAIKSIEPSENEVFDFVIPETHSFVSNGFISHNTPRGKNHMWDLYNTALQSPSWFVQKLTVEDTKHIPLSDIEKERDEGLMSDDLIMQEYYTSFEMGVEGAYYTRYIDKMRHNNQIGAVPYDYGHVVHTVWDLGVRDSTCIIFFQIVGDTIKIIDCYEKTKEGLEHYIKILKSKDYIYGKHIAPHDIKVKEFGSGLTRLDKARQLGVDFTIAPSIRVVDGIEAVRTVLCRTWIDESKCAPLINALENYRQEFDPKRKIYKTTPLHNWASHFADCMRYLAISTNKLRGGLSAEEIDKNYMEVMYGYNSNLPKFFR